MELSDAWGGLLDMRRRKNPAPHDCCARRRRGLAPLAAMHACSPLPLT